MPGLSMFALEEGLTLLLPNGKCYKIFLIPLPNQTFLVIPPKIFSPGFNGYRNRGLHPPTIQSRYVSRCSGAGRAICKMSICQSQSPRLGDTRQGAAEVFTETLQTREFVTDLKYVMGQTSHHLHHRQCHHCGQLWC